MTAALIPPKRSNQRLARWRLAVVLLLIGSFTTVLVPESGSAAPAGCKRHAVGFCVGPLVGPLVVSGHKVLDGGHGRAPVLFQGVMFDGPGWLAGQPSYNPKGFPDAGAIRTLRSWGVDFVRLALSSDIYDQKCKENYAASYPAPGYRQDVTDTVKALTSDGIYVTILLYTSNPGCKLSGPNTSGDAPMPGTDAIAFWHAIASEFGRNPLVGFEPWNEPEVCATGATTAKPVALTCSQAALDAGWKKNLTMKAGKTYADVGMERMYQVIRKAAPSSLVFLDANGWAAQPATYDHLPKDMAGTKQIVDVLHPYDCQDRTPAHQTAKTKTTAICVDPAPEACTTIKPRMSLFDADPATHARLAHPVVFDEIGFPEGEQVYEAPRKTLGSTRESPIKLYQHGLYLHNFIAEAQARGDGFAAFTFNDSDTGDSWNGPYLLTKQPIASGSPGPWTPSADGAVVKTATTGHTLSCQNPPSGFDKWQ
ncbi:MAG TPA: cellulase family glycosylhydrolase [Mycobacteriales bacterium]|nr:cellulase family glycosylhydrolase [Mycobacteriales bacterium]